MKSCLMSGLLIGAMLAVGCTAPPPSPVPSASGAAVVKIPLGLSADLRVPADNPLTPDKIALGRMLYFDKRLSADGTVSCATCHDPNKGWTDNQPVSSGIKGQKGGRSAPTVINATYLPLQFWDGRAKTLEEQVLGPIANPIEMGNTHEQMVKTVQGVAGYPPLFAKAFGGGAVTKERVAQAIASFERTVLSGNSRYDRYVTGDKSALSESEARGLTVFLGKGRCVTCHVPPTFSDGRFHNLGVGVSAPKPDPGRFVVTKDEKDRGAFKTPMLRDVALSAPYMHDGSQKTLEGAVDFYDRGGEANPHLDPLVSKLKLTATEKADLVAFMKALNGEPTPRVEAPELPK